jgi:hypothetical protein
MRYRVLTGMVWLTAMLAASLGCGHTTASTASAGGDRVEVSAKVHAQGARGVARTNDEERLIQQAAYRGMLGWLTGGRDTGNLYFLNDDSENLASLYKGYRVKSSIDYRVDDWGIIRDRKTGEDGTALWITEDSLVVRGLSAEATVAVYEGRSSITFFKLQLEKKEGVWTVNKVVMDGTAD